ncbi:hypothetical protein KCV04_g10, partial [Aureobasidium melanogenum]
LRGKDSSTLLGSPNSTFSEGDVAPRMVAGASEKVTRRLGRGRDSTTGSSMRAFSGTKSKPSSLPGANSDSPAFSGMESEFSAFSGMKSESSSSTGWFSVEGVQGLSYGVLRWASRSLVILNGDQKLAMVSNVCSRLFLKRREIVVQTLLALTQVCHYLVKLFACHLVTMRGMSACKERSDNLKYRLQLKQRVVARRSLERDFTSVLGSLTAVAKSSINLSQVAEVAKTPRMYFTPAEYSEILSRLGIIVRNHYINARSLAIPLPICWEAETNQTHVLRLHKDTGDIKVSAQDAHQHLQLETKNLFRALVMRHAAVHETIRTKLVSKIAIVHTQPTVRLVSALVTVRSLSSDITFYLLR